MMMTRRFSPQATTTKTTKSTTISLLRRQQVMSSSMFFVILQLLVCGIILPSNVVNGESSNGGGGGCIDSIQTIVQLEESMMDYSTTRTYVLCPNRVYEIGTFNYHTHRDYDGLFETNRFGEFNKHPPIPLRSNMHLKCGNNDDDNASYKDNLCWISNGDVHLDATNQLIGTDREVSQQDTFSVDNVVIEGFTFVNAQLYSLWATKSGSITFRNCIWKDHTKSSGSGGGAPIYLDYYDRSTLQLDVKFENCTFKNNRYHEGGNTALVYSNSDQIKLSILSTVFENNDMVYNNTLASTNSFLIETLGSLRIENSCFINNMVGVSNIGVFGTTFVSNDNSITNSTGPKCELASVFETLQQFQKFKPLCVKATSSVCSSAAGLQSPQTNPPVTTNSPTEAPKRQTTPNPTIQLRGSTSMPTIRITSPPSPAPITQTSDPTNTPTKAPITPQPSPAPVTAEPTKFPTYMPFVDPTHQPVTTTHVPTLVGDDETPVTTSYTPAPSKSPKSSPGGSSHGNSLPTPSPTMNPTRTIRSSSNTEFFFPPTYLDPTFSASETDESNNSKMKSLESSAVIVVYVGIGVAGVILGMIMYQFRKRQQEYQEIDEWW